MVRNFKYLASVVYHITDEVLSEERQMDGTNDDVRKSVYSKAELVKVMTDEWKNAMKKRITTWIQQVQNNFKKAIK